ncbi:hypothetical protein BIW11_12794 [Tropilaelaps mercedesae]|uniref:Uncharacterized protein n=1 Tax=Tropilaelaps mercedesae TaxID=418985 RepID=A0A1V9X5E3_9ACAR|nr:hypothetical protein BIW11_12794 [Tropilaelaps mercedesae]
MADSIQLPTLKKRLAASLANRWTTYLELLRRWLTLQIKRDDFEVEARTLMRPDEIAMHNEYLMELLLTLSKAANSGKATSGNTTNPTIGVTSSTVSRTLTASSASSSQHTSSDSFIHLRVKPVIKTFSSTFSHLSRLATYNASPPEDIFEKSSERTAPIDLSRVTTSEAKARKRRLTECLPPPTISRSEHTFGLCMPGSSATPTFDNQLTMPNVVSFAISVPQADIPAPHCSFLMREQAFPESALLYGRMLVVAYEHGLDDIDAATVELMLQALRSQLLRVIAAIVDRRAACSRRKLTCLGSGGSIRHSNPYLRTPSSASQCYHLLESVHLLNELNVPDVESSNICSLYDLVDALRTDRRLICSHTVTWQSSSHH